MGQESRPNTPYIVGVGASAGGLEAIKEFFSAVPKDSGIIWVVIQHLSPDYKSMMKELLASSVAMPIHVAEEGVAPEVDHLYLIPQSMNLTIQPNGTFGLVKQERGFARPNLPIDIFFESMAEYAGDNSIGVVLSGTGSDGTRGARKIREGGGIVLAQNFRSAKFDGMPKSIVDNGLADYFDEVELLPQHILQYVSHPLSQATTPSLVAPENEEPLTSIFLILKDRFRLDFSSYKPATVGRRIERRVTKCGKSSIGDYLLYLKENPSEADALLNDLLIGVTNFFRDRVVFEEHLRHYLTDYLRDNTRDEVRFWVAGCSTGEEAYSLAILFNEICDKESLNLRLKVFATDVDGNAIAKASVGNYPESIANDISGDYLAKYFVPKGDSYTISRRVREQVVFAKHDVLNDPPFTRIDLVSCRNMLIYLKNEFQNQVLNSFSFSLKPGGLLLLGSSESLGENEYQFSTLEKDAKIFRSVGADKRMSRAVSKDHLLAGARDNLRMSQGMNASRRAMELRLTGELKMYEALFDSLGASGVIPFGLLVDERQDLLRILGASERYFKPLTGRIETQISKLLIKDLLVPVSSGLSRALRSGQTMKLRQVSVNDGKGTFFVSVTIIPIAIQGDYYSNALVILQELDNSDSPETAHLIDVDTEVRNRIADLEHELQITRENLQATIEELETSNEELQATNEELLASNEELQSTNEELQSVNEELFTVNNEHQERLQLMGVLQGDFESLLDAAQLAAVFLDEEHRIRRYTRDAVRVFNIIEHDIGRPIGHVSHQLNDLDVESIAAQVLESGEAYQQDIRVSRGSSYNLRIAPYKDTSQEAMGTVLVMRKLES